MIGMKQIHINQTERDLQSLTVSTILAEFTFQTRVVKIIWKFQDTQITCCVGEKVFSSQELPTSLRLTTTSLKRRREMLWVAVEENL